MSCPFCFYAQLSSLEFVCQNPSTPKPYSKKSSTCCASTAFRRKRLPSTSQCQRLIFLQHFLNWKHGYFTSPTYLTAFRCYSGHSGGYHLRKLSTFFSSVY